MFVPLIVASTIAAHFCAHFASKTDRPQAHTNGITPRAAIPHRITISVVVIGFHAISVPVAIILVTIEASQPTAANWPYHGTNAAAPTAASSV